MAAAGSTGAAGTAAAPMVEVVVGAEPRAAAPSIGLVAVAVAAASAWLLALLGAAGLGQAIGAGLAATAAGGWVGWRLHVAARQPARLRWDGLDWTWAAVADAAPVAGSLHLVLDFDAWVLLRFDGVDRRRRWAALARRQHASRWHALRCAVLAHGGGRPPVLPPGALV
jgi:hypothetical protein